jgi:predicted component of type VI protein secretion system
VPVDAPIAAPPPVRPVQIGEQLLLTFDTGQRAQLQVPVAVNLGRRPELSDAEDQALVVQDPENSVSKNHLRLEYRGASVWLTDLGSTNGSEIFDDSGAGMVLAPGSRVRLEDGSRVRIGSRSFTVATVRGEV